MNEQPFEPDAYWQQVLDANDYAELVGNYVKIDGPATLTFNRDFAPLLRAAVYHAWIKTVLPPYGGKPAHRNDRFKQLLDCIDEQFPNARPKP